MIGIIGAMDIEVDLLKAQMQEPQTKTVSGISFVQGLLCGRPAVVARCGVGKVNAAVCAQTMILNYAPESVINTGVAGSLSNTFDIGDVVVADYVVQGDVDTTALGDPPGFISTVDIIKIPCSPSVSGGLLEAGTALGRTVRKELWRRRTALLPRKKKRTILPGNSARPRAKWRAAASDRCAI